MYELKTKETDFSVTALLDTLENEKKRADGYKLLNLFEATTGDKAKAWGTNMIGFGKYQYQYASGHKGEFFKTGFAVRKNNITLYLMIEENERNRLIKDLGKYKLGKGCIYINKLADINLEALKKIISASETYMSKQYPDISV